MKKDLVSILIPNYNYSRYLGNCLDSVLSQTYDNIEVVFRDNCSSDNSLDIAVEYKEKFAAKGIAYSFAKNKYNVGSASNSVRCLRECEGRYLIYLSSDDALKPDFVEKCVKIFHQYPDVGMVMTHRDEMDENGKIKQTIPFYNQSCVIDGEAQAAVFMMAGIAVPSQCMFSWAHYSIAMNGRTAPFRTCGDWYNNFVMSCYSDIAYIKEPLCLYRVHSGNETSASEDDLSGLMEHYNLINAFRDLAQGFKMTRAFDRHEEAIEKLGDMCLRYAVKMLKNNKNKIADNYLRIAPIFKESIVKDEKYVKLSEATTLKGLELQNAILAYEKQYTVERTISYDPPAEHIPLSI